jgi:arylsulfatase A-like enzyme
MINGLKRAAVACAALVLAASCSTPGDTSTLQTATPGVPDRSVLPIADPPYPASQELDARTATPPPRFEVNAPVGAPNVVIVLLDDFGFGQSSTFGGGIEMPNLDRLAAEGLRFNNFHVAALCSPTRVALLTGRNHHSANAGAVMDIATAFPGNNGSRPNSITPLAEILRLNGYSTGAFGKSHETAPWEVSVSGPTDRWPTRSGFDKFYGFIGGETNQWAPTLYDGMTRVEYPNDSSYHFMTDMTSQAVAWVRQQQGLTPDRPFFMYFAPGATHAPHHVPASFIEKYKGRFEAGWDVYREETLARQKRLGVVPPDTKLAPKDPALKDWSALTDQERRVFARQMEIFAAFGEHADFEIGRLVSAIEELGETDNTLFIYIVGDNGASPEGGMVGVVNEMAFFNGIPEALEEQVKARDELGGPATYAHYAAGWAVAGNTPFQYGKQVASAAGGNQNPMVIRWPKRIADRGGLRSQFHYVTDIAPTVLEAAGLPQPTSVNGIPQRPMEGASLLYTIDQPGAPTRHPTQYFEIGGNRGIYHDGWFAGTVHRAPWEQKPRRALTEDEWELYHVAEDFSQSTNLAASSPAKLKELQALFLTEAAKYQVLPIDDRSVERMDPAVAGRPDLMGGRTSLTLYPGAVAMAENAFINLKNRSHTLTATVDIPRGGADGVIIAQAGRFSGWSLYVKNGRPAYAYNWLGRETYTIRGTHPLPVGPATIRLDFAYDGGGRGKGGTATLTVNGREVASGRVANTIPNVFSTDEGVTVGVDDETAVTTDYPERNNRFTGQLGKVVIEVR